MQKSVPTKFNSTIKGLFTNSKWDLCQNARMVQHMKNLLNVIHHTNQNESCIIIAIDAEKAFDKNPASSQ
jgi:hypothetical protein